MKNLLAAIHRIETRPATGRVRVEVAGEVVAESDRALELDERGLPRRYYLPREDVRAELLRDDKRTRCPFKGEAAHFSVHSGGRIHESIAWSYEDPIDRVAEIKGLVAFYDDRATVSVTAA